tara:strand:- start:6370 stop:6909 length:540 start_codon:yes stop_codon:yes gene_type:complete
MSEQKMEQKTKKQNTMRDIKIEKVLLSCGATGKDLDKAVKLLSLLTEMKPQIIKAGPTRRIPAFNVRPGLELGTRVTLRGQKAQALLKRLLEAINNAIYEEQFEMNHFSFGIKEYIEIPGMEYQRDIGIRGLNVTVVFSRPGVRVKRRKIKRGKLPKHQHVSREEIKKFMTDKFNVRII